jgi:tRNA pseudouridine38-40 synthase
MRELWRLDVIGEGGGRIEVVAEATAFLRHMVRNMVGTLVDVGLGTRTAASMADLLARRDRTLAGRTAPPHGLVLEEVFYEK